jgi:hypothetical protein
MSLYGTRFSIDSVLSLPKQVPRPAPGQVVLLALPFFFQRALRSTERAITFVSRGPVP